MALWGGRFKGQPSLQFKKFNDSLPVDYRMAVQDIVGSNLGQVSTSFRHCWAWYHYNLDMAE